MDKREAIELLRGGSDGIKLWNNYRQSGGVHSDFSEADFSGCNLEFVGLGSTYHSYKDIGHLFDQAQMRKRMKSTAPEYFFPCSVTPIRANLSGLDFRGADFTGAELSGADVSGSDFCSASLISSRLHHTQFNQTVLHDARFDGAGLFRTLFNCDLSNAIGLNNTEHGGPSYLTLSSLLSLEEDVPEDFLRGCGLRDEDVAFVKSQVGQPLRFYSCFISYSTADETLATRLHNDLQSSGIRCWKWNEDAKTGRSLWREIDQAIRLYDKLILIASKSSLQSAAVNREIERAIREEDARGQDVLFPVRIDNYIFDGWEHERMVDVTKKVVADATGWEADNVLYEAVRDQLVRDLKADAPESP